MAWGTPVAADRNWQAKCVAAQGGGSINSGLGEVQGAYGGRLPVPLKKFWQDVQHLRSGKRCSNKIV